MVLLLLQRAYFRLPINPRCMPPAPLTLGKSLFVSIVALIEGRHHRVCTQARLCKILKVNQGRDAAVKRKRVALQQQQ